jgi:hypothetical protein
MNNILDEIEKDEVKDKSILNLFFVYSFFIFVSFLAVFFFKKYVHSGNINLRKIDISYTGLIILVILIYIPKKFVGSVYQKLKPKLSVLYVSLLAGAIIFAGNIFYKLVVDLLINRFFFLGTDLIFLLSTSSLIAIFGTLIGYSRCMKIEDKSRTIPNILISIYFILIIYLANKARS